MSAPEVVLCDVDGTVALRGDRSPYDWHAVSGDLPNQPVIDVLRRVAADCPVVFLSGRDGVCYDATHMWLDRHVRMRPGDELWMRHPRDNRRDAAVKRDLYDQHIRGRYTVRCVLDDRDQVVALWRDLGLLCLQVAPGGF